MSEIRHSQGVDLGTSPHGLSADSRQPEAEGCRTDALASLADQQAKRAGKPLVYREAVVRGCCRALKAEALRQQATGPLHLSLSDSEFLHLWFALSNVRSKLKAAISRGRAEIGDLRATDTAWEKLAQVMNHRQRRRPA